MKKFYLVIAMMLLSMTAFAAPKELPVQAYIGYSQTEIHAYGTEGEIKGGLVGFWMDDRAAMELGYEKTTDYDKYQVQLIGSLLHVWRQRITWQIGADHATTDALGFEETDTFYHYGLGYEIQPIDSLTLRAQYNRYKMDADNGDEKPYGVTFSALFNF